jgi:copper chaperone CopZ
MWVEVPPRNADDIGVFPGIPNCGARVPRLLLTLSVAMLALASCGRRSEHSSTAAIGVSSAAPSAHDGSDAPEIVRLEIGGMVCQGCVARVQASLAAVPGVHRVDVSLDDQRAVVLADPTVRDTALTGAVRRAGSEFLGIVIK